MSDNSAPFPFLRTAYLRAVARSWHDEDYFRFLLAESAGPRGVLPHLEREFRFTFPFNVKLELTDKQRPIWDPNFTTGWFGFGDDYALWLPARPSRMEHQAAVLARYYQEFPSLLGAATDGVSQAPMDFGEFGTVTMRLVALVWENSSVREQLYSTDDARLLVQDALDYVVPWNFALRIRQAEGESSADNDEYWSRFPRSHIRLHVPLRPPSVEVEAAALGAYNATGSQYPFSC
jgi:ribosomally synthesized peptide (two-chain TOMM family)